MPWTAEQSDGRMVHMQVDIRLYRLGGIDHTVFTHNDGTPATKEEVDAMVEELKSKGIKVFPCGCENLTAEGYCPGFIEEME